MPSGTIFAAARAIKKIIDAILLAAELFRNGGELPLEKDSARVGEAMPRIDAREKVLGTGKYPDDIYLDGMIYGSAVRSKYPRARVLAIHKEKAEALPGVVGVYTADDIPGKVKVGHLMQDWDTMIPVGKITHYLGDAICLVAAETPEILEKAKKAGGGGVRAPEAGFQSYLCRPALCTAGP